MNKLIALAALAGAAFGAPALAGPLSDTYSKIVNSKGAITVPDEDYRRDWTMLGAWSIAGDEGAAGMHVVYAQPEAVDGFRATGAFPDGTILIKELLGTKTEELTTGLVSSADGPLQGRFVMVKDTEGRFPNNQLWGEGWGWAHFDGDEKMETGSTNYEDDCLGCHVPVEESDWVYSYAYPVLSK